MILEKIDRSELQNQISAVILFHLTSKIFYYQFLRTSSIKSLYEFRVR